MGQQSKLVDTKNEEKIEEKMEEKREEIPPLPILLFVDLHCVGCAKKIEKSIMRMKGVEVVEIDMAKNQVIVKGMVEAQSVGNKITKRTKKTVKLLSPITVVATDSEIIPQVVKQQVISESTTVELNENMHCEACALQLKKKILKMSGVKTVETDVSIGKVTVKGTMDANKLVDYVYRRTKKQARIVPQPEPELEPEPEKQDENKENEKPKEEEPKPEEKMEESGEKKDEENKVAEGTGNENDNKEEEKNMNANTNTNMNEDENTNRMMYYHQSLCVFEEIPPTRLFSDENPNACSIS